ncbi:MAG: adenylate kinase [Candidatus Aenigmatarchaeota archaeon]|nr:adenylate kinase [Candidatus Aenigmarchaeota archaeon]
MKLIIIGPQGSGKGTYAQRISPIFNIPQISAGDLIREEIKSGSKLGKQIEPIVKQGKLIPDEIVTDLVKKRIKKSDAKKGFILDGYPRTLKQAELLNKITKIDAVINLIVPEKIILERISTRLTCENCNTIYNIKTLKPKVDGICDKCGGKLIQREDDKPEAIKRRLKIFETETKPVIDYYRNQNLVIDIEIKENEGDIPPEKIVERIIEKLKKIQKFK